MGGVAAIFIKIILHKKFVDNEKPRTCNVNTKYQQKHSEHMMILFNMYI
jgi:hypothetical protein